MTKETLFIFGEAEKGPYCTPIFCSCMKELFDLLGNCPSDTEGLHYAVQTVLFNRYLIYFRVEEEGFSFQDYFKGFKFLGTKRGEISLSGIGIPGVGNHDVISAALPICRLYESPLILTQKDLYDYLTLR